MARVILYSRRALETDPEHEAQLTPLRAWADANGHEIVNACSDDSTHKKVEPPRTGLDKALYDLVREAADVLACFSLDRIARGPSDLKRLLIELAAARASLFVADIGLDSTTESGRNFLHHLDALLTFELSARGEQIRRGQQRATAKGKRGPGQPTPISQVARIESLLLSGVRPSRVKSLVHVGNEKLYKIRAALIAAGKLAPVKPGRPPLSAGPLLDPRDAEARA
jgi:DNA invertase Pin-like site-specific DNA recombinase